jgi:hypothetical protein
LAISDPKSEEKLTQNGSLFYSEKAMNDIGNCIETLKMVNTSADFAGSVFLCYNEVQDDCLRLGIHKKMR